MMGWCRGCVFIVIFNLLISLCYAAFEFKDISPKSVGMGGIQSVATVESLNIFYNPAGLANIRKKELQLFHTNVFGLEELKLNVLSFAMPYKFGGIGVAYSMFGNNELYREDVYAIGSGFGFKTVDFGVVLKKMRLSLPEFNSSCSIIGLDMGLIIHHNKRNIFGLTMKNFNRPKIGKDIREEIYRSFNFGYRYFVDNKLFLAFEAFRTVGYSMGFRAGVEKDIKNFSLRTGFESNPHMYSIGFTFRKFGIIIDYAFRYHTKLDGQHFFTLGIRR